MATHGRNVPNLVIAQRVVNKMFAAARRFIADETGEAMVGLLVPSSQPGGVPTLYVLDTISPADSGTANAAVREWGMFEQGDDRQDDLIWWLQENWHLQREKLRTNQTGQLQKKWDAPLRFLGDWHKQPGFMIKPSYGDLVTALNWIDEPDNGMNFLLVPIVTLGHPSTTDSDGVSVNYFTVPMPSGTDLRTDFWYIDTEVRRFQPILPAIYPDDQLPELVPYPWHLANEDRFNTEMAQMRGDGLFSSVVLWNVDGELPLEVCFLSARAGSDKLLLLVTHWDYPKTPPSARITPFVPMGEDEDIYDIFERVWQQAAPLSDPPGWVWDEKHFLIDYVHALEKSLGIVPAPKVETPPDNTENQTAVKVDTDSP